MLRLAPRFCGEKVLMNADRPKETEANQAPGDLPNREPALVKLYQELTGEDESQARNTFMFVLGDKEKPRDTPRV